jgi:hypothetical protein
MIQRATLCLVFVMFILWPHGASAQTYNWSFGYPGSPGCVQVQNFNWAVCISAEAACASVAGLEFNSKFYVSPDLQSNGRGG